MRKSIVLALALVASLPASAQAKSNYANRWFHSPSRNILCDLYKTKRNSPWGVICATRNNHTGALVTGDGFGYVRFHVTDAYFKYGLKRSRVLPYGRTISRSNVRCVSTESFMSCIAGGMEYGWDISRSGIFLNGGMLPG